MPQTEGTQYQLRQILEEFVFPHPPARLRSRKPLWLHTVGGETQTNDEVRHHLCRLAAYNPVFVRKRFNNDHVRRVNSKLGCRTVGMVFWNEAGLVGGQTQTNSSKICRSWYRAPSVCGMFDSACCPAELLWEFHHSWSSSVNVRMVPQQNGLRAPFLRATGVGTGVGGADLGPPSTLVDRWNGIGGCKYLGSAGPCTLKQGCVSDPKPHPRTEEW